ncbi:MAG TPA: two-component system sensor histidine kinase CreC [Opitutaceae bacterium]|nr:two-component system sensor histidine kinase CreC [Opitutaceae bacterium]
MKIRTAIFTVYVSASAVAFAALLALVLRDVRLRYIESMRRTLGDTAAFLAVLAGDGSPSGDAWVQKLSALPSNTNLLRVFASGRDERVVFDSARGHDVGQIYAWPMRGGGRAASENYTLPNVAIVGDELRVRAPVRIGGDIVGWVGVGRPLSTIAEGVSNARWQLARYACALAATMVLAGWWIASRLTHSLERLTDYAIAVRDGKRAVPPASRAAEIATLSRAFEEMRVTLEGKAHVERYTQALAHEFKAPLSAIRGAAELLTEDMPREDRLKFLGNLQSESARLQLIVDRLLELSALEARRDGAARVAVNVGEIVSEAARHAEAYAATKKIAVQCQLAAAPRVQGDNFLLSQAVSNLVQNALEFTPPGGTVTLSVKERGGSVLVTVEDSGPGVPDYALGKIFDRFYSLPRPDTGRKSSGLGLSIVREIARLHGGEITLENRPEGGARGTLSLPCA